MIRSVLQRSFRRRRQHLSAAMLAVGFFHVGCAVTLRRL